MSTTTKDILSRTGTAQATAPKSIIGEETGRESSLSNWVGPYVTDMLGKGQAVASKPYEAFTGPLTAGPSALQQQAFQGVANLAVPTQQMGAFTPGTFDAEQASRYSNPFIQQALQPQLQELQRQQELKRIDNAGRMTRAGAYGGGRQAVLESELDRSYLDQAGRLTGNAYLDAYNKAQTQFNTEQGRQQTAQDATNRYGIGALQQQAGFGATQRGITSAGIAADKAQFEEERAYPYKQIQYQQSLLDGMPLTAQNFNYAQPSALQNLLSGAAGANALGNALGGSGGSGSGSGGGISGLLGNLFGSSSVPPANMSNQEFEDFWTANEAEFLSEQGDQGMSADDYYGYGDTSMLGSEDGTESFWDAQPEGYYGF